MAEKITHRLAERLGSIPSEFPMSEAVIFGMRGAFLRKIWKMEFYNSLLNV